ncbi:MAG: TonB-dependent receptor [Alphaproteobacteria bacterium]|nr:TonB-dependent receptor [Alphaproteobacteria bacterium]
MTGIALPANLFGGSFSTNNFIPGFSGAGGLPPQVLMFNPYTVLNMLQGLGNPHSTNIPGYNTGDPAYAGTYAIILNPSSYQNVTEKSLAAYLAITNTTHIGNMPLHINVGIREEITRLTTQGIGQLPTTLTIQTGDHTAFNVAYTDATIVTAKNRYSYLLPNLDLGLDISRTLKARFSASRTLTRPPLNLITPVLNVTGTQRVGSLVASGANPKLRPFQADNFDLALEWYYAPNSYFSVNGFIKHVTDFVVLGSTQQSINGVIDPTTGKPAIFTITQPVNGPAATVRGVEVALQHVFGNTGFGVQANATLVDTNKPYNPNDTSLSGFAVTGLANSANLVAFYDKNGFQIRAALNWRARYLDRFGQTQNNSRFGTEPTFVNASTTVDASASYDITRQFSIYVEALNLTNESYSTTGRYSNQLLDIVRYGRRFTAGVHFRF